MSARRNILIVEDEADLADLLSYNFTREGYACRSVRDGATALKEVARERPDLIVLDRMLPGLSGDDVASRLKRDAGTAAIPIIMLTAKADESDELVGFALGADDYVTKPFSMKRLLARVGAVVRRTVPPDEQHDVVVRGPFTLSRARREVSVNDRTLALTATEYRLLSSLVSAEGRVLTRDQLIDAAIGTHVAVTDRTIDVHIAALRRKVESSRAGRGAAGWIQTIRGVGYAFRQPV